MMDNDGEKRPHQASNAMQVEHNDEMMDDIDEEDEKQGEKQPTEEDTGNEKKKRKERPLKSKHWIGFTKVMVLEGNLKRRKGRCNQCNTLIAADSRTNGTTGLKNHKISCAKKHAGKDCQQVLTFQPGESNDGALSLTSWRFNQVEIRPSLCEMIVLDELPFRFLEREGFKKFVARACPMFKIPCRKTIREDCVRLFLDRKENLKSFFMKNGMGRVSITTDCWTSINNTNFICVTAHFISKNWVLHKKIISFRKIASHKGEDIGDSIIISLEDWDIKSIFCCTVDNASANDVAVRFIKNRLDMWGNDILGGVYLHMRCVAHIINLVVQDGLEEIGKSVRRVREAVKWITYTPARLDQFNTCVQVMKITCKKSMALDVPTRWNSTYLVLESAEPYETAIKLYEGMNSGFVADLKSKKYKNEPLGPPEASDWSNVRKMMEYLKKFFDMTCLVSGTTYVTVHLFFKEMCDIFDLISELQLNQDKEISAMAIKMKAKVGKYWLETEELNPMMNKILYIAALLDPRQKMKHVEKCLKKVYGVSRAIQLTREVKDFMTELFEFYKKNGPSPSQRENRASNASQIHHFDTQRRSNRRGTCSTMDYSRDEEANDWDSEELTLYFAEKQFKEHKRAVNETDVADRFDILNWWSQNSPRFPILSIIARDILAIPISTVASESAFSTGGRVLDAFRSSLNHNMVEALICSQDWLRASAVFKKDEDVPEEEQENEYQMVVNSLSLMGLGNANNMEGSSTRIESGVEV